MRNIIKFEIEGEYSITHNNSPVTGDEVSCVLGNNTLCVSGNDFKIKELTMFNLGKEVLMNLGEYKDDTWTLIYEYPVFPWLHQKLNHGWLIKKD